MSKLSLKYPYADPKRFLKFVHSWQTDIDPIFAGRLAALARDRNTVITILSGFRSVDEQIKLFIRDGGSKDSKGNWTGGTGYVAKPGSSWHNFGGAVDVSDKWLKAIDKTAATASQTTLIKYGIFKPLTKGNGRTVLEDWHIQPIETAQPIDKAAFYRAYHCDFPELKTGSTGEAVSYLQRRLNELGYNCGTVDGKFGIKTAVAVGQLQNRFSIKADGTVKQELWRIIC